MPFPEACARAGEASRTADGATVLGGRITDYLFAQLTIFGSGDDPVVGALAGEGLTAFVEDGRQTPPDILQLASSYCAIRLTGQVG